ncbi:MAG: CNNM domain-containing protein [Verrucomicrobiae bacterium]
MTSYTTFLVAFFGVALCLLLSFLLSGMESGVFALNRLRVRRLARLGNSQAQILHGFLEKPEKFLWTILVGNTLVNFLILGWVIAKLHEWFGGQTLLIIVLFAVIVFGFYSFFDLLPKMLFRAYPNRLCLASANAVRLVHLALAPLVFLVESVSQLVLRWRGSRAFTARLFGNREEMRAVMAEAAQALTSEEHAMVNRVLDLQHFTVAQITIPLAKTYSLEVQSPLRDALKIAAEKNLSRLPVWETRDGKRRIAGMLDVGALLFVEKLDAEKTAGEFMSPALFLDDSTRLEIALRRMQRAGQRLAIVLAHDGSEAGVVSLEDILKLMFGEVKL